MPKISFRIVDVSCIALIILWY